MRSTLLLLIIITIIFGFFSYKDRFFKPAPCSSTIEFSLGTFDSRFGISQDKFESDINQAEQVWNQASGKKLLVYNSAGTVKINLIYDRRQQVTDELKKQGVAIDNDKAVYDNLKEKYDILTSSYNSQKIIYEKQLADFQSMQADYNKQVSYWNSRGGAKSAQYATLQNEKANLESMSVTLNNSQNDLNSLSDQINSMVPALNTLTQRLNIKVSVFNTTGASNGAEFSEGEYVVDETGPHINIYQYESNTLLIRVLEHEFGHALGLEHVNDSKAIMYSVNAGQNLALTSADIKELKTICSK